MKAEGVKKCEKKEIIANFIIIFWTEGIYPVIPETQYGDISDIYGMMECNFDTSLLGRLQTLEIWQEQHEAGWEMGSDSCLELATNFPETLGCSRSTAVFIVVEWSLGCCCK